MGQQHRSNSPLMSINQPLPSRVGEPSAPPNLARDESVHDLRMGERVDDGLPPLATESPSSSRQDITNLSPQQESTQNKRSASTREKPRTAQGVRKANTDGVQQVRSKPEKSRRAFDTEERFQTACTRKAGACVRCRQQKTRCVAVITDPNGPCQGCRSDSALIRVPCLRKKVPDARFTPAQDCPPPYWTTRWRSMEVTEIDDWASTEVRVLVLTQDVGSARDVLGVRRIIPRPGVDSLERTWLNKATGQRFYHSTAPWAIENMTETAHEIRLQMQQNILGHIEHYISEDDKLLKMTYMMAYRHSQSAKVAEERGLLANILCLWVAARRGTKPQRVIGEENLGMAPLLADPSRHDFGEIPVPPIISAQMMLLREALIQRPLVDAIRLQLDELIMKNRTSSWMAIYLAIFILLHNCSLLTAYYWKKARNLRLHAKYHAVEILEELHFSVNILLAHYHYISRGGLCFSLGSASEHETNRLNLDDTQQEFLRSSAEEVKKLGACDAPAIEQVSRQESPSDEHADDEILTEPTIRDIREKHLFHHDYYFLSQLYDVEWTLPSQTIASVQ
ncbi:hypothetical protein F5Y10DRAFT_291415 [Nemania abortiva]|nr:hypothetical protein F5Y10DRAFT_291415 [Nemania abortiva]